MKPIKQLLEILYDIIINIITIVFTFWWFIIPLGLVVNGFFDETSEENLESTIVETTSSKSTNPAINKNNAENKATTNYIYKKSGHDTGHEWAEENDIDSFDDCQSEFGTSDEEDGCNEYVKENYTGYQTFGGYECTEDCSGHEAGYEWAEENDISDSYDCDDIDSSSFSEGCQAYVDENY